MSVWNALEKLLMKRSTLLKRKWFYSLFSVYRLAEELLAKESIGLPDIIRILGERPFPMKETVKEYLQELMERKDKEHAEEAAKV